MKSITKHIQESMQVDEAKTTNVTIDYFSKSKVFQLYDNTNDEVHQIAPEFKTQAEAISYCKKNNLEYKIGISVDS